MFPLASHHPVLSLLALLMYMLMGLMPNNQVAADDSIMQMKTPATCAEILGNNIENDEKMLLCQLYESSSLLTQLGALVSQGLDRLMISQGVLPVPISTSDEQLIEGEQREKKKHEYLRFGKRKHEYLRFGKRKHEYLRFG